MGSPLPIRPLHAAARALVAAVLIAGCGSGGRAASSTSAASTGAPPNVGTPAPPTGKPARLGLVRIGTFSSPTYLAGAPGDDRRLFVVQKGGRISVILNGRVLPRPFLDLTARVNSAAPERGLLSMAFAPDYSRSGRFDVYYTGLSGDIQIVQFLRSPTDANLADPSSARIVLAIPHHQFPNHNGGQLQFGPDGDLYVGVGDGGNEHDPFNRGQDTSVLLGKLLRIRPRAGGGYTIPAGNPFVGRPGRRPEIWAYGLRNPWRFSFDRKTGGLVIGDVGQDRQEEIDYAPHGGAGANYGWSVWEGDRREKPGSAPGAEFPVLVKFHTQGYCALIGGYVVRDRSLGSLYGRYLYGDDCNPRISSVRLVPGHALGDRFTGLSVPELSAFGEDTLGRIYAVSLVGPVYRIVRR